MNHTLTVKMNSLLMNGEIISTKKTKHKSLSWYSMLIIRISKILAKKFSFFSFFVLPLKNLVIFSYRLFAKINSHKIH